MKKYLLGLYKKDYDFTDENGSKKQGTTCYAVIGQQIPENNGIGFTPCVYKYSTRYLTVEGVDDIRKLVNHQVYIDSHCVPGAKYATLDCISLVVENK